MEGRLRRSVPNLPVINPDRLKTAKALVEKAVKLQKVFSVQGPYPVIRSALWARGWVERRLPLSVQRAPHWHGDEEDDGDDGDVSADAAERMDEREKDEDLADMYDLMSRLVRNETSYFYWTTRRDSIDCRSLQRDQMTNHYANAASFTTKVGLCVNLRNLHWFDAADPDTFFPRCYRLGAEDEKQAFIEDYRRTACTSLLQYVVETSRWRRNRGGGVEEKSKDVSVESEALTNAETQNIGVEDTVLQPEQKTESECAEHRLVGPGMIDRALHVCQEFLNMLEHSDIDVTMATPPVLTEQQWEEFLQDYYLVVHEGASIKGSSVFVERCQAMLTRLQEVCPQLDTDGLQNIWIIKPGAKSRGRGIMCMNQLDEILVLVDSDSTLIKDSKWVVQKYLECPLLVHGTKFDLRQWFLVTDWNPLTIWFYKECYLRFSTQPYSTKTLDSSVHLCNNSIQKHFQPSHNRHPELPDDNMWSCSQFRAFLREQGRGPEWGTVVVPGMQQAVIHALQTAQDLVEGRKASFELYGADFMLGRDLRPWLLEINASPTMACSTAVTARLCPAVQLDTLRVVLDWRTDHQAYTGGFQLIYKQAAVEVPQYVGMNLLVEGAPIRRTRPPPHRHPVISKQSLTTQFSPDQSSSEEAERTDKSSGHKLYPASAYCHSGKENQSVGDKKRQLPSASPKRQHEGRTTGQSISSSRRSCSSLAPEQCLVMHTEPQRKARRLGLSFRGAPLVPRTLSYSLNPPCSISDSKPHPNPVLRSQSSRPCPPRMATEPQCRALNTGLPSLHGLLPALEVFSLRPNIVAGGLASRCPALSSHPKLQRHQSFPHSHKQTIAKFKDSGRSNLNISGFGC